MATLLLNPAVLFCLVWGATLSLYSLKYSALLTDLHGATVVLVVGSCAGALGGWLLSRAASARLIVTPVQPDAWWDEPTRVRLLARLRTLAWLWTALIAFELVSFGNLPFLSLLGIGAPILYTEYGFSGLHGLLNAVQLVLFDMALLAYIKTGSRRYIGYCVLLIGWSVLMVTRAIIMAAIVQGIFIALMFSSAFRKRLALLGGSVVLAVVLAFGVLGDLRTSEGTAIENLGQQTEDFPDFLPAGFFWVYVYVTTPLNNINANIDAIPTLGYPYYSVLPLIPNVVKGVIGVDDLDVSLVEESLNVSSFYRQFLLDFGVPGTILVVTLLHWVFSGVMAKARRSESSALVLAVILFCTVISVFVNAYTAIVYLAQVAVFRWLYHCPRARASHRHTRQEKSLAMKRAASRASSVSRTASPQRSASASSPAK